jgi:arylsulfatase A-like enzyme
MVFMTRRVLLMMGLAAAAQAQQRHVVLISIDGGAAFHLDNPALHIPNIRQLISNGAWADGGSETVFPSVTHPSHTTLVTGVYPQKHGVLANDMVRGPKGDLIPGNTLPHSEIVTAKTIFDAAKQQGLTTAAFMWPESVEDKSVDYNFINRAKPGSTGRTLVRNAFTQELEKDGIPVSLFDRFKTEGNWDGMSDPLIAMAACDVIRKHKPDLVAVHLVQTDEAQHEHGPASEIAHAEFTKVDHYIGQIVQALRDAGIYEQTTIIVAADHGFATILHEINIRPYFAEAGLENKVRFYGGRWAPFVRLTADFDPAADQPKLDRVLERIGKNLHVLRVYRSSEFPEALKLPRFEESDRVRGQVLLVADFDTQLVWTQDSDTAWRKVAKPEHGHGYLPFRSEMYPMLVLSGSGIRRGVRIGHVRNVDVAPTISVLLGMPVIPDSDGAVLRQALEN